VEDDAFGYIAASLTELLDLRRTQHDADLIAITDRYIDNLVELAHRVSAMTRLSRRRHRFLTCEEENARVLALAGWSNVDAKPAPPDFLDALGAERLPWPDRRRHYR
jgi:hypothetical protein